VLDESEGTAAHDRIILRMILTRWLRLGDMRLGFDWTGTGPTLKLVFGGAGLFGALGVQLLLAVARTKGFTFCSACGLPFTPKRRPRADERHYHPTCREAALRDAARAYRQRKVETNRLFAAGIPVERIATRIGSKVKTVRGWIKLGELRAKRSPSRTKV
jgi:hypothetical protein